MQEMPIAPIGIFYLYSLVRSIIIHHIKQLMIRQNLH
nr:MAG TPA: hypothetical protein [Caudoviricetes sp.]